MFVPKCLNSPYLDFLKCESENTYESQCSCFLHESKQNFISETIKNDELYKNLYFENVNQFQNREMWKPYSKMRILNCLESEETMKWICRTFYSKKNSTICNCTGIDFNKFAIGAIDTNVLYRNINHLFPIKIEQIKDESISAHSSENSIWSSIEEKQGQIKSINSQNPNQATEKWNNFNAYMYLFVFVFLYLIFMAISKFRIKLRNSYYKRAKYIQSRI